RVAARASEREQAAALAHELLEVVRSLTRQSLGPDERRSGEHDEIDGRELLQRGRVRRGHSLDAEALRIERRGDRLAFARGLDDRRLGATSHEDGATPPIVAWLKVALRLDRGLVSAQASRLGSIGESDGLWLVGDEVELLLPGGTSFAISCELDSHVSRA